MASLTIAGRAFDIAPYKLGSLRRAASFVDRINASATSLNTIEGMVESTSDIVAVLSIGLAKIDPTLTPEALDEIVGFEDLPALRDAFLAVLQESGLKRPGEAKAPTPTGEAEGALSETSLGSSATS